MEKWIVDEPASSLDILPTLSNLLGVEYDSRLLMGRDLFSDTKPLVIFQNRSFITDKGYYDAVNQKFTPSAGYKPDPQYVDRMLSVVHQKFFLSAKILETDYYGKIPLE